MNYSSIYSRKNVLHKSRITYMVLTTLFGDYDILKDPEEIDLFAIYVCITNRRDITSNIWYIIYDDEIDNGPYNNLQKSFIIKYKKIFNIFNEFNEIKYIIRVDASIQIHKSFEKLITYIDNNNYDCCLMLHPERHDMIDEYNEWESLRNHDKKFKDTFIREMSRLKFDINNTGLVETTFQIYKNNSIMINMVREISEIIERTSNFSDNNDQCYYTYILSKYINFIKPLFVNRQIISSDYMDLCFHYTNEPVYKDHNHARGPKGEFIYDLDKPMYHTLFNKEYKIKYINYE